MTSNDLLIPMNDPCKRDMGNCPLHRVANAKLAAVSGPPPFPVFMTERTRRALRLLGAAGLEQDLAQPQIGKQSRWVQEGLFGLLDDLREELGVERFPDSAADLDAWPRLAKRLRITSWGHFSCAVMSTEEAANWYLACYDHAGGTAPLDWLAEHVSDL